MIERKDVDYYTVEDSVLFEDGTGVRWKLVRACIGKEDRIELYRIGWDGIEMFWGFVPKMHWWRSRTCRTCGAAPHMPCRATGAVGTEGSIMRGVHRDRKISAGDAVPRPRQKRCDLCGRVLRDPQLQGRERCEKCAGSEAIA